MPDLHRKGEGLAHVADPRMLHSLGEGRKSSIKRVLQTLFDGVK